MLKISCPNKWAVLFSLQSSFSVPARKFRTLLPGDVNPDIFFTLSLLFVMVVCKKDSIFLLQF